MRQTNYFFAPRGQLRIPFTLGKKDIPSRRWPGTPFWVFFCWHLFVCLRESYGIFNLEVGGHKRNRVFVIIVPICRIQASPQSEQKQTNLQWQNVKFLFRRPFPKRARKRSFFSQSCFFLPSYITSNQNSRLRYDGGRRKRMSSFDPP